MSASGQTQLKKRKRSKNRTHRKVPKEKEISADQQRYKFKKEVMRLIRKSKSSKLRNLKKSRNQNDETLGSLEKGSPEYEKIMEQQNKVNSGISFLKDINLEECLNAELSSEDINATLPEDEYLKQIQIRLFKSKEVLNILEQIKALDENPSKFIAELPKKQNIPIDTKPINETIESNDEIQENIKSTISDEEIDTENLGYISGEDTGKTEGFTILVPNFGETYSDSDSDVATLEVRDYFMDSDLDEQSDSERNSPPRKKFAAPPEVIDNGNDVSSMFISSLSGESNTKPKEVPKKKKKKNRMGQNARRRLQEKENKAKLFEKKEKKTTKVFKEETQENPNEEIESLHPSWAARKKTTNIADFSGKKITFDDDSD